MSINSLANAAAARRSDVGDPNEVPDKLSEIAAAATTPPEEAPAKKEEASDVSTALHIIFGYIPTEVVTLYVAVSTALEPVKEAGKPAVTATESSLWISFFLFLIATPLVVWVIFANKIRSAGKRLPLDYSTWPVWEMIAATVAFCAWAYALPNSPFRFNENWYAPGLGSIAVLFASTVLGLIAPLFQRALGTGSDTETKQRPTNFNPTNAGSILDTTAAKDSKQGQL